MNPPDTDSLDSPARLRELKRLKMLDTADERYFDDIAQMAADLCEAPIALITLVDEKRQWFKARVGISIKETTREIAFCAHAVASGEPMVVSDATKDPRFVENPLVTGDPGIRFYAGAPLTTASGQHVGTLCVIDHVPRVISHQQLAQLKFMANEIIATFEQRALRKRQFDPKRANLDLGSP